jgi:5-methyltetrahydrofolate--homocysteine methyltransferase
MIIIGEKINASIPAVKTIIQKRDDKKLIELAQKQTIAGSAYIDVNVGTGEGSQDDEISAMQWAIEIIQDEIETPLCIDSADPILLKTALEVRDGRISLINSTKAEDDNLKEIIPLAVRHNASLIALAMDEHGIPKSVQDRLNACEKIAEACIRFGLSLDKVFFDPLVLPISTDIQQGRVTLDTLAGIKKEFPTAKTVMGLSNVSYGLPKRAGLNAAFLHMAVFVGLDAAIMDPLDQHMMAAVRTAEVLVGKDRHCRRYTRALRKNKSKRREP